MQLELIFAQQYLPVTDEAQVTFLLRLLPETRKKAAEYPLDIRLVLDHSGSMDEEADGGMTKLEALKEAVKQSLGILRSGKDRVSIVIYDDQMQVLVDPRILDDVNAIKALIGQIRAGGSTHLSSPLRFALEVSETNSLKDALPKIIIFTDGLVNFPSEASEKKGCLALARQANKMGVPFGVFGTGVAYDENFLKQMAELAGRGSYYEHVRQVGVMSLRLEEDLENLKSIQDRDVEVRVELGNAATIFEATKYVPQQQDFPASGKLLEDKFQGLDVRGQAYLLKTEVKPQNHVGDFPIGKVTVSWKGVMGPQTATLPIAVNFTDDPNLISPVNKTVLNTVLNTEAVKATLAGHTKRAETLFTKAGNQAMVDKLKTLGAEDEDAKRTLRTATVIEAHDEIIVAKQKKTKGGRQ